MLRHRPFSVARAVGFVSETLCLARNWKFLVWENLDCWYLMAEETFRSHASTLMAESLEKGLAPRQGKHISKFQNQVNFKQARAVSTHPNVVFVLILDGDSRSDTSKAFGQYGKSFWCLASSSNHQRYTVWQLWMTASVLWLTPPPSSWCFETER